MRRKNGHERSDGTGRIKFRVIEFEMDGGDDTLAEGMKALTTAWSKSAVTTVASPRPALTVGATAAKPTGTAAASEVESKRFVNEEHWSWYLKT